MLNSMSFHSALILSMARSRLYSLVADSLMLSNLLQT